VVAGLRQDDELVQSEVFGPVITVQKFADEAEALEWANGAQICVGENSFKTR
jgi:betaine-aldehyde dehydrogenase